MNILVINAGSSSLKYQLINTDHETVIAKGIAERIGIESPSLTHKTTEDVVKMDVEMKDHTDAVQLVMKALLDPKHGVIQSMKEIDAVGHRVVHGGESFASSVIIDEEVIDVIEANTHLAPLHNPANMMGIRACRKVLPDVPMVAVFDTAFHQSMPPEAYIYAIPYEAYTKYGYRRYGFHGTSHKFVSMRAAKLLNRPYESLKTITCHLGNGSSIAAVKNGKSVDTSMGLTPLEGLPMGTRSGNIDPAIVYFLMEQEKLDIRGIEEYLNRRSGVLGISGVSSDFRDILEASESGNKRAALALAVVAHRVKSYIGSYAAVMGGVDCVIFTAGVGENNPDLRAASCKGLEFLGVGLDLDVNEKAYGREGFEGSISRKDTAVQVLVIPTNEELMIARETAALL
jgi:acetate kinase